MTTIKISLIENAGNGLFTTKCFKKGEFICYYDGEEKNIKSEEDFSYSITNPFTKKTLIGYNYIKNNNGVGQFINDYCSFNLCDDERDELQLYKINSNKINEKIKIYNKNSISNSNVSFKKGKKYIFKLYATRDINCGEELYLHYGINYWISKIQITCDEPFTKLWCLLKNENLKIKNNNFYIDEKIIDVDLIFTILSIFPNGNIIKTLEFDKYDNKTKILKIIEMLY